MAIDVDGPGWRRAGPRRPLVIAHRGASARALENTTAAFALAAQEGADGVELDVLLCASGEVVVFHDDDLKRLVGRRDRIADLRWRDLRNVQLTGGLNIPTLADAIAACGSKMLINIELKSRGQLDTSLPRLVSAVASIIDPCGAAPRVLVSSFDPRAVALWKRARPDVPCALLIEDDGVAAFGKAMTLPLLAPIAVHPQASLCRPDLIAAWRRGGYLVNTWTVDAPDELRALAAAGVDGIITNDPAGALAALGG